MSDPSTVIRKDDVDDMFEVLYDHSVLEDVRCVSYPQPWNAVYDGIQWFYRVTHPYMTPTSEGKPHRPSHQEILE